MKLIDRIKEILGVQSLRDWRDNTVFQRVKNTSTRCLTVKKNKNRNQARLLPRWDTVATYSHTLRYPSCEKHVNTVSHREKNKNKPRLFPRWDTVATYSHTLRLMAGLCLVMLAGCSAQDEQAPDISGEEQGNVTFTLHVPQVADQYTRAYNYAEEPTFANLYLVAIYYNQTGNTYTESHVDIQALQETDGTTNGYTRYTVSLDPGYYKFYILGNTLRYLDILENSTTTLKTVIRRKADIDNLKLYFHRSTPLIPGHLPMAALHENMRQNNAALANYVYVPKRKEGTPAVITADLTYLCSKVRYTLLFDDTENGFSSEFGNTSLRFNVDHDQNAVVARLRSTTYLYKPTSLTDEEKKEENAFLQQAEYDSSFGSETYKTTMGYWELQVERCEFPTDVNYPASASTSDLDRWSGDGALIDSDWKLRRKKAWQGTVYLPENDDNGVARTMMVFPYVLGRFEDGEGNFSEDPWNPSQYKFMYLFGNKDEMKETHYGGNYNTNPNNDGYSHGLQRNMFYDVVAKVVTPDQFDVTVYVNVLPWEYETDEVWW